MPPMCWARNDRGCRRPCSNTAVTWCASRVVSPSISPWRARWCCTIGCCSTAGSRNDRLAALGPLVRNLRRAGMVHHVSGAMCRIGRSRSPGKWSKAPAQDNRLNCVGVRFDRFTLGPASRRPWKWDVRKVFNTEEAERTTENHGAECKLRFARSALTPYSVPSSSSLLPSC